MRFPGRWLAAMAAVLALVAAACGAEEAGPEPTIQFTGSADGASMKGNLVEVAVAAKGIRIVKADGDVSGKTGHYHIFIDRGPVAEKEFIPQEEGVAHSAESPLRLYGLSPGEHRLTAVLGDGNHRRLGSSKAELTVTVEGPSVSAELVPPIRQPATVGVKVEGVTLVAAKDDTSGKAGTHGHLHLLIDKEPAAGQPIPQGEGIIHTTETQVQLPTLPPGDHTVWVVLGYADHTPFDPPVVDRVEFTVA